MSTHVSALVVAAGLVMSAVVMAQQPQAAQYLISTRALAGNPENSGAMEVVAAPTFRVPAGQAAVLDLGDATGGFKMSVTVSDLGDGKCLLRVIAEARRGDRVQRSTFDVLAGPSLTVPTVALRDATGAFMVDKNGKALFVEFSSVTPIRK